MVVTVAAAGRVAMVAMAAEAAPTVVADGKADRPCTTHSHGSDTICTALWREKHRTSPCIRMS